MRRRTVGVAAAVAVALCVVAACGGTTLKASGNRLRVVAAENFYGDLAGQIGGNLVSVTSILSNPNTDPHLFEPGTRNGLAVSSAQVVIANGAGYDDWMTRLLAAAPSSSRRVVMVADVLHVSGTDPNPHLWYEAPALPQVVSAFGEALVAADPGHAASYRAGVRRTVAGLQPLLAAVHMLRTRFAGAPVAFTERVPGLLLQAAGLRVTTPPSFARAVENGTDPTAGDVAAMQRLLTTHAVKALLYNEQATSPLTARLQQTAHTVGVPVVPVTETEPAGMTFADWQVGQVRALLAALTR